MQDFHKLRNKRTTGYVREATDFLFTLEEAQRRDDAGESATRSRDGRSRRSDLPRVGASNCQCKLRIQQHDDPSCPAVTDSIDAIEDTECLSKQFAAADSSQ